MIDDRMEDGFSEEEAVAAIGLPEEIVTESDAGAIEGKDFVKVNVKPSDGLFEGLFKGLSKGLSSAIDRALGSSEQTDENRVMKFRSVSFEGDIHSVCADTVSSSVRLYSSDEDKIRVVFSESANQRHEAYVKDGCLWIKQQKRSFTSVSRGGEVEVWLPRRVYAEINLDTTSGSIKLDRGISAERVKCESVSGSVHASGIEADAAHFETVSGSVSIAETKAAKRLSAEAVSGSVKAESIASGAVKMSSVSGSVTLTGSMSESLKAETTSGRVKIQGANAAGLMKLSSVSGHVEVSESDAGAVKIDTMSGTVDAGFLSPKIVRANSLSGRVSSPSEQSGGLCEVDTMSGRISITF